MGESFDDSVSDALALLVSEVVTNSVVHAGRRCSLRLFEVVGRLRVVVSDGCDDLPVPRRPSELAESGRGLALVEALSDAWGVDVEPSGGKAIWFEMEVRSGPPTDGASAEMTSSVDAAR